MKIIKENETIWAEKYRPRTTDDLILDDNSLKIIREWVKEKSIPNIALVGVTPGVGKTSLAKSLLKDIDGDLLYINASLENGIDVIRNKMMRYASNRSIDGKVKAILLDEADGLSNASQESLKAFIEEFSMSCRFILTANYKNRLIEPLINRCQIFDFDTIFEKNRKEIKLKTFERLKFILNNEKVKFNETDIQDKIIKSLFPSIRAMILLCQKLSTSGELLVENITETPESEYKVLIDLIGARDFVGYRRVIKTITDVRSFYEWCFKNCDIVFKDNEDNIAKAITIIYDFNRDITSGDVKDYEVSLAAFGAKLITSQIEVVGFESPF